MIDRLLDRLIDLPAWLGFVLIMLGVSCIGLTGVWIVLIDRALS